MFYLLSLVSFALAITSIIQQWVASRQHRPHVCNARANEVRICDVNKSWRRVASSAIAQSSNCVSDIGQYTIYFQALRWQKVRERFHFTYILHDSPLPYPPAFRVCVQKYLRREENISVTVVSPREAKVFFYTFLDPMWKIWNILLYIFNLISERATKISATWESLCDERLSWSESMANGIPKAIKRNVVSQLFIASAILTSGRRFEAVKHCKPNENCFRPSSANFSPSAAVLVQFPSLQEAPASKM